VHDTRRTRLVLGVLLIVALGLITLDHRGSGPVAGLRGAFASIFGPVERGASAVARPVTGFFEAIVDAPSTQHKVQSLEQQNQRLRADLSAAQLSKSDAAQLNRLLQLAGRGRYRIVAAHVVGIGQGYEDTVTIDAGTRDGIRTNQTVLNSDGLVGRVIQAGSVSSTVLLAADSSSAVGCRLEGSQEIGVVRGTGRSLSAAGMLRLELLDANANLQPGQRIVTLGSVGGYPYVPGVPIGVVTRVETTPGALTRSAVVRPFVSFTALDVVGVVVVPPRHNPRDSVLPPQPSPSPAPSSGSSAGATPSPGTSRSPGASPSPGATTGPSPGASPGAQPAGTYGALAPAALGVSRPAASAGSPAQGA
jgi:rod shape-determining protein MreC